MAVRTESQIKLKKLDTSAGKSKNNKQASSSLKKKLLKSSASPTTPAKKPVLIPKQFDQAQVKQSCRALLGHAHPLYLKNNSSRRSHHLESTNFDITPSPPLPKITGEPIFLNINTFEPITNTKTEIPTLIPVPNKIRPKLNDLSVCLIVNNPQKAVADILTGGDDEENKEKIPTNNLFSEIISTSRLRSTLGSNKTIHPHKAAVDWAKSFDLIVCDGKLKPQALRSILGPKLYNKPSGTKIQSPLPITFQPVLNEAEATPVQIEQAKNVVADPATIKRQLKFVANCVTVAPSPGTALSVLVGLSSFTKEQLIENISAVLKVILNSSSSMSPESWSNIRSMYIKTAESASLPLYISPDSDN